ncbi:hypothetical protein V2J09_012395 [Rumex salicifolius]
MDNTVETALLQPNPEEKKLSRRLLDEMKMIARISLPSMVFRVTSFGVFVVTQSFVGHIDAIYLAAYALVQSISLRFINGIVVRVAIGSGSQIKVAVINVVAYYVIGVPLGCLLAFVADLGVKVIFEHRGFGLGIWIGMLIGMVSQVIALVILTWRVNWEDEVNKN